MSVKLGYKITNLGEIPAEWPIVSLAAVSRKIIDIDHKMPPKTRRGIPFVSVKYLLKTPDTMFKLDQQDEDLEFISDKDYAYYSKRFDAEYEDILYSRFGTIGTAKLICTKEKIIASYSIALIKSNKDVISPLFLTYMLNSAPVKRQAHSKTKGSTNQNLHLSEIRTINVPLPDLAEQQKIASILLKVDEAIRLCDNIIIKAQQLRKGLVQQLFAEEWEVVKLGEVCESLDFMRVPVTLSERTKRAGNVPYYGASGQVGWINDYIFDEKLLLVAEDGENLRSRKLPIAYSVSGKSWVNNHAHVLRVFGLDQFFLECYLNSIDLAPYLLGATRPKLNKSSLMNILIPKPSSSEQHQISSILSKADERISVEKQVIKQMQLLKNGLMQTLLTGQIRTKAG